MPTWLKGMLAAALGGGVTGATTALGNGVVNQKTIISIAAGALVGVVGYLTKSPTEQGTVSDKAKSAGV